MTRYDFTEATDFLNNSVPLSELYEDVLDSMRILSSPRKYIGKASQEEIWSTLLTCADFIDTIQIEKGGKL